MMHMLITQVQEMEHLLQNAAEEILPGVRTISY